MLYDGSETAYLSRRENEKPCRTMQPTAVADLLDRIITSARGADCRHNAATGGGVI